MQLGRCLLTYIPMRAEPTGKSEQVSQLIYGEHYKILDETSDWSYISNEFDNYQGWISNAQVSKISAKPANVKIVSEVCIHGESIYIPCGAEIEGEGMVSQIDVFKLCQLAKSFLSTPYLWGGRTFMGIDCSGFIQVIHKAFGIRLPRDAKDQALKGKSIIWRDIMPGDVIFFSNTNGQIIHTGLLIEAGLIIHAHGHVRIDKLDETGIYIQERNQYSHRFHCIRRFI